MSGKEATNELNNKLHLAASNCNYKQVEALLKSGADPKHIDEYGSSVLHKTRTNHDGAVIGLLIKSGADIEALDKDGKKALDFDLLRVGDLDQLKDTLSTDKSKFSKLIDNIDEQRREIRRKGEQSYEKLSPSEKSKMELTFGKIDSMPSAPADPSLVESGKPTGLAAFAALARDHSHSSDTAARIKDSLTATKGKSVTPDMARPLGEIGRGAGSSGHGGTSR